MDTLADILETTAFERVSSGHVFTEGPLDPRVARSSTAYGTGSAAT